MPKLRKMLGEPDSQTAQSLMALMETQSHATLTAWAAEYAAGRHLPLTGDPRLRACLEAVRAGRPLAEIKPLLAEARKAAGSARHPVTRAASRAVAAACGVATAPTSALGFCFYAAAAYAYATAGIQASQQTYDALAEEELGRLLESLRAVAVENEANPAKLNWGC